MQGQLNIQNKLQVKTVDVMHSESLESFVGRYQSFNSKLPQEDLPSFLTFGRVQLHASSSMNKISAEIIAGNIDIEPRK